MEQKEILAKFLDVNVDAISDDLEYENITYLVVTEDEWYEDSERYIHDEVQYIYDVLSSNIRNIPYSFALTIDVDAIEDEVSQTVNYEMVYPDWSIEDDDFIVEHQRYLILSAI